MGKPSKSLRETRFVRVSRNNLKNRLQLHERRCQLIIDESVTLLKKAQQELQELKKKLEEHEKRVKLIQERVAEKKKQQEEDKNNVKEKLNDYEENWLVHVMDNLKICDYNDNYN